MKHRIGTFGMFLQLITIFISALVFSMFVIFVETVEPSIISIKSAYVAVFVSLFLYCKDVKKQSLGSHKTHVMALVLLLLIDTVLQAGMTYLIFGSMAETGQEGTKAIAMLPLTISVVVHGFIYSSFVTKRSKILNTS